MIGEIASKTVPVEIPLTATFPLKGAGILVASYLECRCLPCIIASGAEMKPRNLESDLRVISGVQQLKLRSFADHTFQHFITFASRCESLDHLDLSHPCVPYSRGSSAISTRCRTLHHTSVLELLRDMG